MERQRLGMDRQRLGVGLVAALLAVAGCSSGGVAGATSVAATAKSADASLSEFKIALDNSNLAAGSVTFTVANKGTIAHEFVVLKTDLSPDAIPSNGEGGIEEEGNEKIEVIDEAEDIAPGVTTSLTVDLKPGRYLVMCNVPGHFIGGMHASVQVTSG